MTGASWLAAAQRSSLLREGERQLSILPFNRRTAASIFLPLAAQGTIQK